LGLCIASSTALVPRVPLQPADFVGAVSEPASGSGLTGLPVGAPPVTSARLANRLATARAVLFFLAPGADAGLGFVLLVVLGTGPRPVPWLILPPRPAVTLAYDSGGPLPDLRDAAATLTRSRDQQPSTALDVGVAGPCSRGLRRGIRLHTVRRGAQPDLFRQLGCLEADFNGHGGLVFPVVKSGDSGYPVAPRLKIPFGRFPRSSLSLSRPLPTLSPSLIGHLASVNVKQHQLTKRQRPFSPSVPAGAGCLFTVAAGVHVFISGESL